MSPAKRSTTKRAKAKAPRAARPKGPQQPKPPKYDGPTGFVRSDPVSDRPRRKAAADAPPAARRTRSTTAPEPAAPSKADAAKDGDK